MGIFSGLFRSRDKPKDSYDSPSYTYFFGRTHAGKRVNDRTAMQIIAVYACVRVLSEAIAQLPLHVYQYTDNGKERVPKHPLYFLLHDQPNPEMTSFVFRETLMSHLLIYGNAFAQIIRNGRGEVLGLYPLMPDKVRVDRDDHGRLIYRYSRYDEHNPNFKQQGEIILPAEQVLHIPGLGFDGLVGYSPIAMAKNAIRTDRRSPVEFWVCGNRKKKGGHCPVGGSINHEHLKERCTAVLGLPEFDETEFLDRVDVIYVPERETLEFHLKDGTVTTVECRNTGHQDCWTAERRAETSRKRRNSPPVDRPDMTCFTKKIKCVRCGCNFRKNTSSKADGSKVSYWRCAEHKGCGAVSLRDDLLHSMTARVLDSETLDEAVFEGFKSMVEDALAGKIDLIITKSVSRFARNTVDSLTTIRTLKEHNVECFFEKKDTLTAKVP
ncbi:MAG: phage portal protein [Oscillospiraceae bacterium]|nr:phage portal protein [Oscillospiraceae bacterium]